MKLEIDHTLSELIAKAQLEAPGDVIVTLDYYGEYGDAYVNDDRVYIRDAVFGEEFRNASPELSEIAYDIIWHLVDNTYPGWNLEHGGSGNLTLDLGAGTITWRHFTNVVHQELDERIGDFCGNAQSAEKPTQQDADESGEQPG